MFEKNSNKVLPINILLDVQQKLFGSEDFKHGNTKKRKNKKYKSKYEIQSKFDLKDYNDPEIKLKDEYNNRYFIEENGTLGIINPICPHCKSRKVKKWSVYHKNILSEEYCGEILIRRYYCKRCQKTFITNLNNHFDFHSNISNSLKEKSWQIKELNWSSLRDIAEYYKNFL